MKVGIMGGTFDPVHQGHLIMAERAREEAELEEVWFIPSHVPPHKVNAPQASPQHRWEMVHRAVAGHDHFKLLDIELKLGGTSYSVQTVSELKKRYPRDQFYYIIGADMVQYLPHWHKIEELVKAVAFIGAGRPGTEINWEALPTFIRRQVEMISLPQIDISSTEIRERCAMKKTVRYLLPESVLEYIKEHRLYDS